MSNEPSRTSFENLLGIFETDFTNKYSSLEAMFRVLSGQILLEDSLNSNRKISQFFFNNPQQTDNQFWGNSWIWFLYKSSERLRSVWEISLVYSKEHPKQIIMKRTPRLNTGELLDIPGKFPELVHKSSNFGSIW